MKRISVLGYVVVLFMVLGFDGNRAIAHDMLRDRLSQSNLSKNLRSETADQWVELGQRVHGGFGSYIALGIRIGLDAMQQLEAEPRDLDVTYYNGAIAPCPCVVDGIMIATVSTPGQHLLRVATTPSPVGTFGVAEIRDQKTGKTLRYIIPATAQAQLDAWNRNTTGRQRYDAVMNAPEHTLFSVEVLHRHSKKSRLKVKPCDTKLVWAIAKNSSNKMLRYQQGELVNLRTSGASSVFLMTNSFITGSVLQVDGGALLT